MSIQSRVRSWWKALAHRSVLESEMEAELRLHIENYAADLVRTGITPEEALRRARMELGTVAAQKEEVRSSLGLRWLDDLISDLRYGFRQLRHAPAFTATVITVLALGLGANAAMFSIIDGTLLRRLPYRRPAELLTISPIDEHGNAWTPYYHDIAEWKAQSHTLESLAYYNSLDGSFYSALKGFLDAGSGGHQVSPYTVSANLFTVLGVQPALGRAFLPSDQAGGSERAVILSYPVWHTLLQSDPAILGKQVKVNDLPYTVVGVMPKDLAFPADDTQPQVWVPAVITPGHLKMGFDAPQYKVIGRLTPGSSITALDADMSGIEANVLKSYPAKITQDLPRFRVRAIPYRQTLVVHTRPALLALVAVVLVIWLIACLNIGNLMLARGTARQREMAVRGALGAGRWRIVRQLFTESLLLSILGAVAGLALGQLTLGIFSSALSQRLNLPAALTLNAVVLGELLGLTVLSALLFGLLPAWLASRESLESALRQNSAQTGAGRYRQRLQQLLVAGEIALSLTLLVACGLLLRTVFALRQVPLGFRTEHVLTIKPELPAYKFRNVDANLRVYQPLLQRIKELPGVEAAAITTEMPLDKGFAPILTIYGNQKKDANDQRFNLNAYLKASGPELQKVLGFRMVRGRFFNQQDTPNSQLVAVVNRAFERAYPQVGDVMKNYHMPVAKGRVLNIVGVVDDFHQDSIGKPAFPEIDVCAPQLLPTDNFYQAALLIKAEIAVRTSADPQQMIPELRKAMLEINPGLQGSSIKTMDEVVEDSMGDQLLAAHLLELFGGIALLIALAGLHGLLSYLVAQQTREFGVRLALGAQRQHIMEIILGRAGRMLAIGAFAGAALSWFASRLLAGYLFGVKPHDPATMVAVAAVLLLCGLMSACVPAHHASRIDPMEALRTE